MTRQEHLLTCLAEECSEVAHRVSKSLRFGLDDVQRDQLFTNAERITHEFADLLAIFELLVREDTLPLFAAERVAEKKLKVLDYLEYAHERGTLTNA